MFFPAGSALRERAVFWSGDNIQRKGVEKKRLRCSLTVVGQKGQYSRSFAALRMTWGDVSKASAAEAAGDRLDAMAGLKPGPPEERRCANPMAA